MTKFEMKTMKDYHDAYLKRDVLLSAYLFETFRNYSLKNYGLCPSWNRLLKITKIELEIIPDPDMYIFLEKGTRGGISYIFNRHNKVNNKCLKSYDLK